MKKTIKIILIFLFAFIVFGLGKEVNANSIYKISMDIYINEDGEANVTEVWNCFVNKGTEAYHPYYNLGSSKIKDLQVQENGKKYETLDFWDASGTFSDKAYKCGVNYISQGVELCWGIGQYGFHTYTIQYTITDFIMQLSDSQMLNWTFIPYDFSESIGNVNIKIHTYFNMSNAVRTYGFGNHLGLAYVRNGNIEMYSLGVLKKSEYMSLLVKFPANTFNVKNISTYNFDDCYRFTVESNILYTVNRYKYRINSLAQQIEITFYNGYILFAKCFPFILIFIVIIGLIDEIFYNSKLKFGVSGKRMPHNLSYCRNIPFNNDIFRAYYIGYEYKLLKNKTDILGAIILKWLYEGKIKIEQKDMGKVFKRENTQIILKNTVPSSIENDYERDLFIMLLEASKDGILENNEFTEWCSSSYHSILSWFNDILYQEKMKLVDDGLIKQKTVSKFWKLKEDLYIATPELKQKAIELAGLKKFLKDYTLISNKESIEVSLFEEYLIYAQMMGIAKIVGKEFKKLYPEIIKQSKYVSYDNISFIDSCSYSGVSTAKRSMSRASNHSSGDSGSFGGGSSSGGSGSFGGGGGGGGFR